VQQVGLVNFYVGKMRVEVDLARLHLTIGEDNFDLGALSRAGEAMAELTEEFVATVRAWTSRLSATVVRVAREVPTRVRRVTVGIRTLALLILGRIKQPDGGSPGTGVLELEMVLIPPGRFVMGVSEAESKREKSDDDDARPQHEVHIGTALWLGKYPVTRGEFEAFVADTGRDMSGGAFGWVEAKRDWEHSTEFGWLNPGFEQTDRHPVVCVSHADAEAYAAWLSHKTGRRYRLPSEAEWEYAARAGTATARFWGDDRNGARRYANGADRSLARRMKAKADRERFFPWDDGYPFTSPVESFQPNGFGLHDMLGNVWEWVADQWHGNYDAAPTDGSVWMVDRNESRRVLRGGAWDDNPWVVRAGIRNCGGADDRVFNVGFRLARTL
jgi:formylglycine-generating enzyme required for sulfatase activity